MHIISLIEDTEGIQGCVSEHGLSIYLETAKHKILFRFWSICQDIGKMQKNLGIDLSKIDIAILSHGHYDHSGGILPFIEINPDVVIYMQEPAGNAYYHISGGSENILELIQR